MRLSALAVVLLAAVFVPRSGHEGGRRAARDDDRLRARLVRPLGLGLLHLLE